MARLINFDVHSIDGGRVVGKSLKHSMTPGAPNPIPALWERLASDGTLNTLADLAGTSDNIGWMGDYQPETGEFVYLAGVLAASGIEVPEGYDYRDVPPCLVAHGSIEGTEEGGAIYMRASELTSAERDERGFVYDDRAGGWEMEVYSEEKFIQPMVRGERILVLDYWSPCRTS